jgi:hypothetical protein
MRKSNLSDSMSCIMTINSTPKCHCPAKCWRDRDQRGTYSFNHDDTYVEPARPAPPVSSSLVKPGVLWSSII